MLLLLWPVPHQPQHGLVTPLICLRRPMPPAHGPQLTFTVALVGDLDVLEGCQALVPVGEAVCSADRVAQLWARSHCSSCMQQGRQGKQQGRQTCQHQGGGQQPLLLLLLPLLLNCPCGDQQVTGPACRPAGRQLLQRSCCWRPTYMPYIVPDTYLLL